MAELNTRNQSKTRKILCIAEAFGFGPASKLCILINRYFDNDFFHTTFVGNGCAFEMCENGPFHEIRKASENEMFQDNFLHNIMFAKDILISSMEFTPLPMAKKLGLHTLLFDSLFWMWPEVPVQAAHTDLYICQNFINVRERCENSKLKNYLLVPPLTMSEKEGERSENLILLNFGGMENPFADRKSLIAYATCMYSAVKETALKHGYKLEVYGRSNILDEIKTNLNCDSEIIRYISQKQFVDRMNKAKYLITSPGLETLYEAFTMKIPVFLLPPQNNSQAYQAQILRTEIPLLPGPQYDTLLGIPEFKKNTDPEQTIKTILNSLFLLQNNKEALKLLELSLEEFLTNTNDHINLLRDSESNFIEKMKKTADCFDKNTIQDAVLNL